MMMTKKLWLLTVLFVGGTMSTGVAVSNRFVPSMEDVADPLGRPSALALELIHSSSELERITGILVPKHADLRGRIGVLNGVSDDLDAVAGSADSLDDLTMSANSGAARVGAVSIPLPGLIGNVTARSTQAVSAVDRLHGAAGSISAQLEQVVAQEQAIYRSLQQLGPRARSIAAVLANIEQDTSRLKTAGPVLRLLSGAR